jgi:hypothetical protein
MENYKGYDYEISLFNPKEWNSRACGWLRVESAVMGLEYFRTFEEAENAVKLAIDKFIENIPQTKDEWVNLFYLSVMEDNPGWKINEQVALEILKKASKHFND